MKVNPLLVKFQDSYRVISFQLIKKAMAFIIVLNVVSCTDTSKKVKKVKEKQSVSIKSENKPANYPQDISFFEFKPDTLTNFKLIGFDVTDAYQIGLNKIIIGYDQTVNPDYDKDWGDKLLLLNNKDEVLFKSKGVGDVYLFEPHFYKNGTNNKIVIVCQLAYEYFFGGEVFLYENEKIDYVGNIDIDGKYEETSLIDILKVNENNDGLVFTFNSDSVTYKPANEAIILKNNNIRYEYKGKKMKLIK